MPIATATYATLDQVVSEIERDGQEIVQLLAAEGSVKILYRDPQWQTRVTVGGVGRYDR